MCPSPRLIWRVTNMPVHVAGSVQPSQERWFSGGHVFAPSVSQGDQARMSMLLATIKLRTGRRRVRCRLVLTIVPESQKKLVPRNIVTFARSMGAHSQCTILEIAVSSRKTEWIYPISAPLRKAERNPIPQNSLLRNKARKWTSSRRWSRKKAPRSGSVAVAIAILTPNRELGRVA